MSELRFVDLEAFAAEREDGAEPIASAVAGGAAIPAGGSVIVYGDGGAGKTTLVLDLALSLARGESWLGLIEPPRPLRVAIVENEGPRPMFREKISRKLDALGCNLDGRVIVLDEPWARFTFADDAQREHLAAVLTEHETDMLIVGPLSRVGTIGGGTLDETAEFERLVLDVRARLDRPLAVLFVHHQNRAGRISGAWEGVPDLLLHVTGQGNGRTRLYWQKVRWSSALHGTSTSLLWADGDTYTIEAKPEVTDDTIETAMLAAIRENGGASWTKIRDLRDDHGDKRVRGGGTKLAAARDRLIEDGALLNTAPAEGEYELWAADDPAAPRSAAGTTPERLPFPSPDGTAAEHPFPVPPYRNGGTERTAEPGPEPARTDTP